MSPFEYITVLISIVLGLGISQIVTGVADIIHQWEKVKIYWPHILWMTLVFFLHVQEWWWLYELKSYEKWRLPVFLFVILYPIVLFVLARILFPSANESSQVNLKDFYFNNYRKFFLLIAISALLAILEDTIIQNYSIADEFVQLTVLAVSALIAWRRMTQEWLHKVVVIALVLMMLITFAIQWNNWLIG